MIEIASRFLPLLVVLLVAACMPVGRTSPRPNAPVTITDREWVLVELGGRTDLRGAGGSPATLRLDAATSRASGFAGCNRFTAGYALAGDALSFQPAAATRMACAEGMELEAAFLAALPSVTSYEATATTLTLRGAAGTIARFRAPEHGAAPVHGKY